MQEDQAVAPEEATEEVMTEEVNTDEVAEEAEGATEEAESPADATQAEEKKAATSRYQRRKKQMEHNKVVIDRLKKKLKALGQGEGGDGDTRGDVVSWEEKYAKEV